MRACEFLYQIDRHENKIKRIKRQIIFAMKWYSRFNTTCCLEREPHSPATATLPEERDDDVVVAAAVADDAEGDGAVLDAVVSTASTLVPSPSRRCC